MEKVFHFSPQAIDGIAQVCHEANRAFCKTIDDFSQPSWEEAPEWQKQSAINGVKFHLTGEYGPQQSHENWMREKIDSGWVYGPVKDAEKKTHPSLRPFSELSMPERMKDILFATLVLTFKAVLTKEL